MDLADFIARIVLLREHYNLSYHEIARGAWRLKANAYAWAIVHGKVTHSTLAKKRYLQLIAWMEKRKMEVVPMDDSNAD